MVQLETASTEGIGLVDALDHLINRGAVILGRATIALADVDLIHIELRLLLSSVETLRQLPAPAGRGAPLAEAPQTSRHASQGFNGGSHTGLQPAAGGSSGQYRSRATSLPKPMAEDPSKQTESSLAQLVLALAELLRQLIERQAMRRVEGGSLSEEQEERMGLALMELASKMAELREAFGLKEEDVQLKLSPHQSLP